MYIHTIGVIDEDSCCYFVKYIDKFEVFIDRIIDLLSIFLDFDLLHLFCKGFLQLFL